MAPPWSEQIFHTKSLILTSTTALERLPASIRFRQCSEQFQATIDHVPYFRAGN